MSSDDGSNPAARTVAAARAAGRLQLGSPSAWSVVFGSLALLSFVAVIPLCLPSGQLANGVIATVIGVPCAGVGFVVSRRQRDNPLGWLFLVIGVCLFLGTDGGGYAVLAYRLGHHLPLGPLALALDQVWGPSLVLLGVVILLQPSLSPGPSPGTLSGSTAPAAWLRSTIRPAGSAPSRARSFSRSSCYRWPSSSARR